MSLSCGVKVSAAVVNGWYMNGKAGVAMSKKAYSQQEREQVGKDLLAVGLEMLSQRGLKDTKLQDILRTVGISKPFFYGNYYTSLAELVAHIINYEMAHLYRAACSAAARQELAQEEKIYCFMDQVIHSRQHHFFVMTQEEEVWVYKHLSPEDFDIYQQGQVRFYEKLLALWNISQEKCSPKELGNLLLTVILIHNSAARSLPFFFPEELERTARAQAIALSRYLADLSDTD